MTPDGPPPIRFRVSVDGAQRLFDAWRDGRLEQTLGFSVESLRVETPFEPLPPGGGATGGGLDGTPGPSSPVRSGPAATAVEPSRGGLMIGVGIGLVAVVAVIAFVMLRDPKPPSSPTPTETTEGEPPNLDASALDLDASALDLGASALDLPAAGGSTGITRPPDMPADPSASTSDTAASTGDPALASTGTMPSSSASAGGVPPPLAPAESGDDGDDDPGVPPPIEHDVPSVGEPVPTVIEHPGGTTDIPYIPPLE